MTDTALGQGQTILLVEDKVLLRMMTNDLLVEYGYNVITAGSGDEALALLEDGVAIDLLLTDVSMPGGVDGLELAHRAQASQTDLPIVFMTGLSGFSGPDTDALQARFLEKPTHPEHLAKTIHEALASG